MAFAKAKKRKCHIQNMLTTLASTRNMIDCGYDFGAVKRGRNQ